MDERRSATRELVVINLHELRERPIATLNAEAIDAVLWQGASNSARLIVSARARPARPLRLWEVSIASGQQHPVTDDASDYLLAGLSYDRQRVIAVRVETSWSLWVASLTQTSAARQVDAGTGAFDLLEGVAWTPGGRIVYTHAGSGNLDLWQIDPDTGTRAQVTSDLSADYHPSVSPDGRTVVFASDALPGARPYGLRQSRRNVLASSHQAATFGRRYRQTGAGSCSNAGFWTQRSSRCGACRSTAARRSASDPRTATARSCPRTGGPSRTTG